MLQEQGIGGLFKGWMATLVGYSCQGACKFGFYEFFKKCYSNIAGPENAERLKTLIYLAASASAEVIADVALCPMEAVKIRVQTQPGFARCLIDGLPKIVQSEGAFGYRYCKPCVICVAINHVQRFREQHSFNTTFANCRLYKGLLPLWGRQVPCKSKCLLEVTFFATVRSYPPLLIFINLVLYSLNTKLSVFSPHCSTCSVPQL